MPGPAKGSIRLTSEHRDKIRKSRVLTRLISHAEGDEAMSQTEVTAALGLLKFAFPPLQPEAFDDEQGTSAVTFRWKS
jgi:hypothetical protein